ncbi:MULTISPECIES: ketoacyl-ACP synthase III family protein [Streptomyces]|uniref:3-oxoacyl-[acyl-carrier-protein] synthase-3 n=1 Tax=Streptomyces spororaveus TaxID=284039 RepID=A0ABQ3T9S7_9ACTN|nr:ketoacyl-ACP synthase III family protein [Streptomyces spororaveus]MCM9082453.1 ketoacyl-ACP synthase III family protein [Streptomyces spororaveus]GHI77131.1 hypothetical protein Sspor_26920 [Streptomyces spororaveus]
MRIDDVYIGGIGAFLPPFAERPAGEGGSPLPDGLTGALVAGELPPPEMAVRAARQAFERAGADPSTLDLLFHVSVFHQGPDGWLPQSYIQRELGLDPHAMAVELRQGCNGMFTGLELAISHLRADAARGSALLTAAENFNSALVDRWTAHPGSYLGDSGSAVLLTRRPGFARLRSVATVSVPELEQLHRGDEALFPPGATVGRPLDFGRRAGQFRATAEAANVPALLGKARDELLARVLDESGTELTDVTRVVSVNTARAHAKERLMDPLGLPMSRSAWEFGSRMGHLGAGDQFLTLERMAVAGALGAGDRVLMIGVGPGLSIGAAVVEIVHSPDWA